MMKYINKQMNCQNSLMKSLHIKIGPSKMKILNQKMSWKQLTKDKMKNNYQKTKKFKLMNKWKYF